MAAKVSVSEVSTSTSGTWKELALHFTPLPAWSVLGIQGTGEEEKIDSQKRKVMKVDTVTVSKQKQKAALDTRPLAGIAPFI